MPSQLSGKSNSDWHNPILDHQFFNRNLARIGDLQAAPLSDPPPKKLQEMLQIQWVNSPRSLTGPLNASGEIVR
jgi:hypothetical protein